MSERKREKESLRASEERCRQLVEEIDDIAYMIDAQGEITYVSPALERLSGYGPSEVVGRRLLDFVHCAAERRVTQALSVRYARRSTSALGRPGTVAVATSAQPSTSGSALVV